MSDYLEQLGRFGYVITMTVESREWYINLPQRIAVPPRRAVLASAAVEFEEKDYGGVVHTFIVAEDKGEFALKELCEYELANVNWPPKPFSLESLELNNSSWHAMTALYYVTALLLFYFWIGDSTHLAKPFANGVLSAADVCAGNFYQCVTALTLHSGWLHVLNNAFALFFLGIEVSRYTGSGLGWFYILFSGAVANLLNAFYHSTNHYSVGASTAVFAALGILCGCRILVIIIHDDWKGWGKRDFLIPLIAGVAIVAISGSDHNTDVSAHWFGFLAGNLFAFLIMPGRNFLKGSKPQVIGHIVTILILICSWRAVLG